MANRKPSVAQLHALHSVVQFGRGTPAIYMPYADNVRSYEACERRGWLRSCSVSRGDAMNGYALTEAGEAVRQGLPEPTPLGRALKTLMELEPTPVVVPDLTPAKPGWYWCCFDDGVSFDPGSWYSDVGDILGRLGEGPVLTRVAQDLDGTWFGWLPHGGLVEIGEDPSNRMVRLSYPKTVGFQASATGATVRVTWLGEAPPPPMPDEVESDLTELGA